jgi:hypothetical protein
MELLYFEPAYQLIGAPYVNTWMQSSKRPDFISKNQTTDGNATSSGCAMLFIYYLCPAARLQSAGDHQQSGRDAGKDLPMRSQARMAATRRSASCWQSFSRFGDTPLLPLDNPFPLLDGKARDVCPTATESQDSPPEGSISGTATYNACGRGPTFKLRVDAHQPERTAHLRRACNRIRSAGIQQED